MGFRSMSRRNLRHKNLNLKSIRNVSLYNASEAAFKFKPQGEIICCGDYCRLITRADQTLRDQIEWLMKLNPRVEDTLFKLLELHQRLSKKWVKGIKSPYPTYSEPNQCKIMRKAIIDDRKDPNSFKNKLLCLPTHIAEEIRIKVDPSLNEQLNSKAYKPIEVSVYKIEWEFESVPVCDLCYLIYEARKFESEDSHSVIENPVEIGCKKARRSSKAPNLNFEKKTPEEHKRTSSHGSNFLNLINQRKLPNEETPRVVKALRKNLNQHKVKRQRNKHSSEEVEINLPMYRRMTIVDLTVELLENLKSKIKTNGGNIQKEEEDVVVNVFKT